MCQGNLCIWLGTGEIWRVPAGKRWQPREADGQSDGDLRAEDGSVYACRMAGTLLQTLSTMQLFGMLLFRQLSPVVSNSTINIY